VSRGTQRGYNCWIWIVNKQSELNTRLEPGKRKITDRESETYHKSARFLKPVANGKARKKIKRYVSWIKKWT
jgi:hypothetical protein